MTPTSLLNYTAYVLSLNPMRWMHESVSHMTRLTFRIWRFATAVDGDVVLASGIHQGNKLNQLLLTMLGPGDIVARICTPAQRSQIGTCLLANTYCMVWMILH